MTDLDEDDVQMSPEEINRTFAEIAAIGKEPDPADEEIMLRVINEIRQRSKDKMRYDNHHHAPAAGSE